MSNKRKPKSQTSVDWFMSNLLFTQKFHFETSLDIDTVVTRLHETAHERKGWRHPHPRFVLTSEKGDDLYWIDLRAKDKNQQYTISHATGSIESTANNGAIVRGEIRFGVVYFFLLIVSVLWMVFIFQFFGLTLPIWALIMVMIAPLFTFGHMFWKRNQLLKELEATVKPRMSDRTFEKLKHHEQDTEFEHLFTYDDTESKRYDQQ